MRALTSARAGGFREGSLRARRFGRIYAAAGEFGASFFLELTPVCTFFLGYRVFAFFSAGAFFALFFGGDASLAGFGFSIWSATFAS